MSAERPKQNRARTCRRPRFLGHASTDSGKQHRLYFVLASKQEGKGKKKVEKCFKPKFFGVSRKRTRNPHRAYPKDKFSSPNVSFTISTKNRNTWLRNIFGKTAETSSIKSWLRTFSVKARKDGDSVQRIRPGIKNGHHQTTARQSDHLCCSQAVLRKQCRVALPHCCVQILSLTTATEKSCRVQDLNSEPKLLLSFYNRHLSNTTTRQKSTVPDR